MTFILVVAWPLLTLPAGVFSKGYFTFWIIVAIVWVVVAALLTILLPLREYYTEIRDVVVVTLCSSKDEKDDELASEPI
jgi:urea-proton symporter